MPRNRRPRPFDHITDCRFGKELTGRCCTRFHKASSSRKLISQAHSTEGASAVPFVSPLTRLLGTGTIGREHWVVPVAAENRCSSDGEEAEFRHQCGAVIRYMDAFLPALRFHRGLVIRLASDDPKWGWGHVLTVAFAWHFLCVRLHRFCYLQLFDSQFDRLFGYANGAVWKPTPAELDGYQGKVLYLRNQTGHHATWTSRLQEIPRLFKLLRQHDSRALVVLDLDGSPPFDSHHWLPYDLPLRHDKRSRFASSDVEALTQCFRHCPASLKASCHRRCLEPWDHVTSRLDRCFARYVTEPMFAPSPFHKSMASLPVALHLRTGWADVTDAALRGAQLQSTCCPNGWQCAERPPRAQNEPVRECITTPARVGLWFQRACNATRFASRSSWIMSDNPFLLQHLHSTHKNVHSNLQVLSRLSSVTAAAQRARESQPGYRGMVSGGVLDLTTTRIWKNSFEPKREAALDAYVAGLLPEIQISPHTSFARPIVARSMCTRRVVPLTQDGVCPEWDLEFHRDMWGLSGTTTWPCIEESLPKGHGCKGLQHTMQGGLTCRRYYVASMLTA